MRAASEKTFPVLTAMHHTGKNVRGYPGGARHKPTLSAPCAARCRLLSLPLIVQHRQRCFPHVGDRNPAAGTTRMQRDRDGQRPFPQTAGHAGCVAG